MSDGWNPVREEFFKRTLSRDFKTIYQRQLDIAEEVFTGKEDSLR